MVLIKYIEITVKKVKESVENIPCESRHIKANDRKRWEKNNSTASLYTSILVQLSPYNIYLNRLIWGTCHAQISCIRLYLTPNCHFVTSVSFFLILMTPPPLPVSSPLFLRRHQPDHQLIHLPIAILYCCRLVTPPPHDAAAAVVSSASQPDR